MSAEELLAEVDALGVTVRLDGDILRLRPGSAVPPGLVEALRAHKPELLELVLLRGWPEASRDAVRRFQVPEARLYPFLGEAVATRQGPGRLLQVFSDRAAVALDSDPGHVVYLLPSEVRPPGMAADPGVPFEAVH
jgi:hypothetical protein